MSRTLILALLVVFPVFPALAQSTAPAKSADPLRWELPSLVDGKSVTRSLHSFIDDTSKTVVVVLETANCPMCDKSAPSNRALAKAVRQSDSTLVHILYGPPGDLEKLLANRVYAVPVLFDLDGSFTRTLGLNPAEAPVYAVIDDRREVLAQSSGQKVNPATIQLAILSALLIRKTQGVDGGRRTPAAEHRKSFNPKPATP